jgi:hypothetical protein
MRHHRHLTFHDFTHDRVLVPAALLTLVAIAIFAWRLLPLWLPVSTSW